MAVGQIDRVIDTPVAEETELKFQYPGMPTTCDGAEAVVWVETRVCQGSGAYPITSSTTMGGGFNAAVTNGIPNLWGEQLIFMEPESEHSSATFCEGFALAGGRVTNFTSGQGLVLMKEVLYTIAGKRLPAVFHVGARALTSQALNVHCGHDDVMAVADCGWGIAFAKNGQEVADLAVILRRVAEEAETPFLCVQDGFLTTHTVENVRLPEPELMAEFVGDPYATTRLRNLMNPERPVMSGVVQNQESYAQGVAAQRPFYFDHVSELADRAFDEFAKLTGRHYARASAYLLGDAHYVLAGQGSVIPTAEAVADYMRAEHGVKVGVLNLSMFRPFPADLVTALLRGKVDAINVTDAAAGRTTLSSFAAAARITAHKQPLEQTAHCLSDQRVLITGDFDKPVRIKAFLSDQLAGFYAAYGVMGALLAFFSFWLKPNANSLHHLYRDRLSRAFHFDPNSFQPGRPNPRPYVPQLSELASEDAPYHLINTAINVQSSAEANRRGRNADFFMLSPLFVGSRVTVSLRRSMTFMPLRTPEEPHSTTIRRGKSAAAARHRQRHLRAGARQRGLPPGQQRRLHRHRDARALDAGLHLAPAGAQPGHDLRSRSRWRARSWVRSCWIESTAGAGAAKPAAHFRDRVAFSSVSYRSRNRDRLRSRVRIRSCGSGNACGFVGCN